MSAVILTAFTEQLRLFSHFLSSMRKRGLLRTIQISTYELWYDVKFGGGTGRVISTSQLGYSHDAARHAQPYFPSSFLFLHEIFSRPEVSCDGALFVDYGCGMGRALMFASTRPFRRVIGVELSERLCEIANENMRSYYKRASKRTPDWSVLNMDVRQFIIPEDATIFYMYNPFDATVLAEIVDHILESVSTQPRRCIVIYANPIHEEVIAKRGLRKLFAKASDFAIYELQ